MSFSLDLRKFAEKTSNKGDLVVRKIVFDLSDSLVMKTPVGDADYWINKAPPGYVGGRARGNWQYGLNAPNLSQGGIDKTGDTTIGNVISRVPKKAAGNMHYITNTLVYIKRLEEGWSKRQAPRGMIRITVAEFRPIVEQAARLVN